MHSSFFCDMKPTSVALHSFTCMSVIQYEKSHIGNHNGSFTRAILGPYGIFWVLIYELDSSALAQTLRLRGTFLLL